MKTQKHITNIAAVLWGVSLWVFPTQAAEKGPTTGKMLEVIQVEPVPPAALKAGERAKVKIRYECTTAEGVRIWVQPYTQGHYTPDGFYAPSAREPKGVGSVNRFVGVNGTAQVDELRVSMVDADTKKEIARITHAVSLKWAGTVPKPATVAPVGKPFPELRFTSLTDQPIDLAKLKGKVVLVDFWATWCGPCCKEIPNLAAAYEKYHPAGFEIVGISLDQKKNALEKYIKENRMPWAQYFDGKGWQNDIGKRFAVQSIPCSYLIDRKGVVRYLDARGEALTKAIAKLIAEAPPGRN